MPDTVLGWSLAILAAVGTGWVSRLLWPELRRIVQPRGSWLSLCRWGLAPHKPVRVIDGVRPLNPGNVGPADPTGWRIVSQHYRCRACGVTLGARHDGITRGDAT